MKTKSFFIKLAMTLGVLLLVLGLFFGASITNILLLGILLTIIGFAADLVIMPRIGGVSAAFGDFFLAFLVIYLFGSYFFNPDISVFSASLLSSLFIAGGEFYFHKYLVDRNEIELDENVAQTPIENLAVRTEFSEDFDKGLEKRGENE